MLWLVGIMMLWLVSTSHLWCLLSPPKLGWYPPPLLLLCPPYPDLLWNGSSSGPPPVNGSLLGADQVLRDAWSGDVRWSTLFQQCLPDQILQSQLMLGRREIVASLGCQEQRSSEAETTEKYFTIITFEIFQNYLKLIRIIPKLFQNYFNVNSKVFDFTARDISSISTLIPWLL